ncbi:hypothetical protein SGRA_1712 [Saprospira grandis str. Lewin]|uniref:Uncharacterized protein n=1 Tax=Saprospira grandis (strain Lewin) TaxID=984262 RepID=H6LAG2_SAPGL|nr:hypothetical protein SGRA_1712 [Saprospira grandis str. Lewin]
MACPLGGPSLLEISLLSRTFLRLAGPQAIARFKRTHFYRLQQFPASRPYFSRP